MNRCPDNSKTWTCCNPKIHTKGQHVKVNNQATIDSLPLALSIIAVMFIKKIMDILFPKFY